MIRAMVITVLAATILGSGPIGFRGAAHGQPAGAATPGEEGEVLTLDEAIAQALRANRQVKNASLDVAKAGDQIASAKTRYLPQFQVGVTPSYLLTPLTVTIDRGSLGTFAATGPIPPNDAELTTDPGFTTAVTAGVSQPISQLYKIRLNVDQLGVARDISRQSLRSQRQAIVASVKQAYYAILQSESTLRAQQEMVASSRELVRVVTEQVAQGTALRSALLQAKASLASAEYSVGATQRALASQKEQLNHYLGRDLATPFRVVEPPAPVAIGADMAAARTAALRQRPELQKASLQVDYADYSVKLKQAEYIPDVSLVFRYLSPITSDVLPRDIAYVGVDITWDVFDWGKKRQDLAQLRRAREQARNSVADTASQIVLDVNSAFRKLEDSQAFLAVAEAAREAAREQLRVVTNQYRQQAVLLKDVLAAQAALGQANDQYRQAALAFWEAQANLDRALGTDD